MVSDVNNLHHYIKEFLYNLNFDPHNDASTAAVEVEVEDTSQLTKMISDFSTALIVMPIILNILIAIDTEMRLLMKASYLSLSAEVRRCRLTSA